MTLAFLFVSDSTRCLSASLQGQYQRGKSGIISKICYGKNNAGATTYGIYCLIDNSKGFEVMPKGSVLERVQVSVPNLSDC